MKKDATSSNTWPANKDFCWLLTVTITCIITVLVAFGYGVIIYRISYEISCEKSCHIHTYTYIYIYI